jgi:hypothetical protein
MDTFISEHYQQATLLKGSLRIIVLGWEALVEKLGYADATRFVMLLDKGSGDSVQYFRDLWEGKTAEDIYREMNEGKLIAEQQEGDKYGTP